MPLFDQISSVYQTERCHREDWNIFKGTHFHDCYEMYYLEEGEITYFVDENIYTVRQGDFILIPPGVMHKTLPYHRQEHSRILIYFKPEFLGDFLQTDPALLQCFAVPLITMARRSTAEHLLFSLLEEQGNLIMSRSLLGELLVWLGRWGKQEPLPETLLPESGCQEKVQEIVRYLNTHYMEDITLPQLSDLFYMSSAYMSRTFRKVMGISYSEYLIRVRIRQAIYLLNHTKLKVTEIAQKTGFHSDNHFCKMFRQITGISPLKYRISMREK